MSETIGGIFGGGGGQAKAPDWMSYASLGLQAGGAAMNAQAAKRQAAAEQAALNRRAELESISLAQTTEQISREKTREQGAIIASMAARGIALDAGAGSVPLLLLSESADEFDRALRTETFNAQARMSDLRFQGELARYAGRQKFNAEIASGFGGALTSIMRQREQKREEERIQQRGGYVLKP